MMNTRIVELVITDDLDEFGGVDGVALVSRPAHEENWLTFNTDTQLKNIYEILDELKMEELGRAMGELGEQQGILEDEGYSLYSVEPIHFDHNFSIASKPNDPSGQDTGDRIRYKYVGPRDEKNRHFCKEMMTANRVYRIEDIQDMTQTETNAEFGYYDIFKWRGSFNCRHFWVKLTYKPSGMIINKSSVRKGLETEQIYQPQERTITNKTANAWEKKGKSAEIYNPNRFTEIGFSMVGLIDNVPVFDSIEDAEIVAEAIGCSGHHIMTLDGKEVYVPCEYMPSSVEVEMESYTDYPQYMTDAAQDALNYIEKSGNPNDCMTQVGKVRAQQLAQRKPISLDTIKRMKNYMTRHLVDLESSTDYEIGCGKLAMASWGCRNKEECNNAIGWLDRKITKLEMGSNDISFDYDDTLSTEKGQSIAEQKIKDGFNVFVISARQDKEGMLNVTDKLGIPRNQVYATGSNKAKVEKVLELNISKHIDNNQDVVNELGSIGEKFNIDTTGISPYTNETGDKKKPVIVENFSTDQHKFSMDDDKMEITGAAIVPNKFIIRVNEFNQPYYVFFSEYTTKLLSEKFMYNKMTDSANIEHTNKSAKAFVSESWIVENSENDKSNELGLTYPQGTWVITMKVQDPELWGQIKQGKYKGFSIEGFFTEKLIFNNIINK